MSYDVWLEVDTGGEHPHRISEYFEPTYNLAPMFALALGIGLRDLTGKTGAEAQPILRRGIAAMEADPAPFEALNPSNGWGSYAGALKFLKLFLAECEAHPKAVVHI